MTASDAFPRGAAPMILLLPTIQPGGARKTGTRRNGILLSAYWALWARIQASRPRATPNGDGKTCRAAARRHMAKHSTSWAGAVVPARLGVYQLTGLKQSLPAAWADHTAASS